MARAASSFNAMFKVIRSNIKIAITPPRIARFHSNLVQSFIRSQRYTTNVHGQRSKVKVKVTMQRNVSTVKTLYDGSG